MPFALITLIKGVSLSAPDACCVIAADNLPVLWLLDLDIVIMVLYGGGGERLSAGHMLDGDTFALSMRSWSVVGCSMPREDGVVLKYIEEKKREGER